MLFRLSNVVVALAPCIAGCGVFGPVVTTSVRVWDPHQVRVVGLDATDDSARVVADPSGAIHVTSRFQGEPGDRIVDAAGTFRVSSGDFGFTRPLGSVTYGRDAVDMTFRYDVGGGKSTRHVADVFLSTSWSNVACVRSHYEGDRMTGGVWVGGGLALFGVAAGFAGAGGAFGGRGLETGDPSSIGAAAVFLVSGAIMVGEGVFHLLYRSHDEVTPLAQLCGGSGVAARQILLNAK